MTPPAAAARVQLEVEADDPPIGWVDITPALAGKWLKTSRKNRRFRLLQGKKLSREMKAGRWRKNGEAIKFGVDAADAEVLLDGHHRLWAICDSGVTLRLPVVRGLPLTAQITMDQGIKRTGGDALSLQDTPHAPLMASIARIALTERDGDLNSSKSTLGTYGNEEIVEFVERNPSLLTACAFAAANTGKVKKMVGSAIGYTSWKFRAIDPALHDEFFDAIFNLTTNGPGDPRYALLQRFASGENLGNRPGVTASWIIIRAWNAWRMDLSLQKIPVDKAGTPLGWAQPV